MPKALADFLGYVIYFWVADRNEPVHVHVAKGVPGKGATKIWIKADGIELVYNDGKIPSRDLKNLLNFINENKDEIVVRWMEEFKHAEYKN